VASLADRSARAVSRPNLAWSPVPTKPSDKRDGMTQERLRNAITNEMVEGIAGDDAARR